MLCFDEKVYVKTVSMGGIMYKAIVTSNHVCSEDGQTRCNEDRPLPEYTHTHKGGIFGAEI